MFTRRARLRRVEHPGLPADPGERHAADPRPRDGLRRPGPRGPDPEHDLQRARPGDPGAVHPRPAAHRPEGRGLPEEHRHRRHQLLGAGGRVLHLRRRPLRPDRPRAATTTSTRSRASGTPAAQEGPNLGYKLRHKEGYFPCPPADQFQDLRSRDDPDAREGRACRSRSTTTRSAPPARPRSTCGSAR